jgi:hypothetical protein
LYRYTAAERGAVAELQRSRAMLGLIEQTIAVRGGLGLVEST